MNGKPTDEEVIPDERPKDARLFTMLENNPEVMNDLASRLGLSPDLAFYDVYSIYDPDLLAIIPRPVYALLATIPMTEAWRRDRDAEDAGMKWYGGSGPAEPTVWFRQTVTHGCGLIGFLHCVYNGLPDGMVPADSELGRFLAQALPLGMNERAKILHTDGPLYAASEAVAQEGDTAPIADDADAPNHFLALVKGRDGHLWELEGSRKGPLDRGALEEHEDALSDKALELGIKRLIEIQKDGDGCTRFSCIALAPRVD